MKKLLIVLLVAVCAVAFAERIAVVTIAEAGTTATWTNNTGTPKAVKLASAFGTLAGVAADADTVTATVTSGTGTFTVDSGTITSNLTVLVVDFADEAWVGWGETVTLTRTTATTNEALSVMIVTE